MAHSEGYIKGVEICLSEVMVRFGLLKPKQLIRSCRRARLVDRGASSLAALDKVDEIVDRVDDDQKANLSNWVPHPRTGIYYPKGHERVMDNVPEGAASFEQTFWLRSEEGTDKPVPDDYSCYSRLYANL